MNGYPNNMRKYLDFFSPTFLEKKTLPKGVDFMGHVLVILLCIFKVSLWDWYLCLWHQRDLFLPSNGTRSGSTHETGE